MPLSDSWLEIIIPAPLFLVFALLLVGLIAGGVFAYSRLLARMRGLTREAQSLRAELAEPDEPEEWRISSHEGYRHFIYNLSHEVSNPLQSIQTNLDNMASCSPNEAGRWRQYHTIIAAEVQRLSILTERLRLLSHLETPDVPTVREPLNLKGIVESVLMALFDTAEMRGIRVRYVGPERPVRILGDRDQLYQVLANLVDNAIKYSQPEGGEVIIAIQEKQDRLLVRVSDEGVGISEQDMPYIFDTIYRAPDARSFRRKGSGLGLAIAKRIVEKHGGMLRVESKLGEGTTLCFDLPLYAPP